MGDGNAMWRNETGGLAKARRQAGLLRSGGARASAHSIMLSAYIAILGGKSGDGRHLIWFSLLATWHAFCLFRRRKELNHNQLDVLIQFLLRLRSQFGILRSKNSSDKTRFDWVLLRLANSEVRRAESCRANPHQLALAFLTQEQVRYAVVGTHDLLELNLKFVLDFEKEIRTETDQPQGLRQLVRIYRKTGELYSKMGREKQARYLLEEALKLAKSEADAPDQVPKIERVLATL